MVVYLISRLIFFFFFFFFNDTATTEIYTLSLHDALPICSRSPMCRHVPVAEATGREWPLPARHSATNRIGRIIETEDGFKRARGKLGHVILVGGPAAGGRAPARQGRGFLGVRGEEPLQHHAGGRERARTGVVWHEGHVARRTGKPRAARRAARRGRSVSRRSRLPARSRPGGLRGQGERRGEGPRQDRHRRDPLTGSRMRPNSALDDHAASARAALLR